jgi:hypothetical protein
MFAGTGIHGHGMLRFELRSFRDVDRSIRGWASGPCGVALAARPIVSSWEARYGGLSSALLEATEVDSSTARYVNDNLADYLVAVNADVPSIEIIMIPE